MQTVGNQIAFREFSSTYKLIRKGKDAHLGDHLLMKNCITKRRVIVKNHECRDQHELATIIGDYEKLTKMHAESDNICAFVGYSLQESNGILSINLIYDHEKSTLAEEVSSMVLKKEKFYEKQLDTLITCALQALATLEKYGLNHECLKYSNILVEGRGTIELAYRLFYTPYLTSAPAEIKQSRCSIEDYNLSERQIDLINATPSYHEQPTFAERLRIDKQSLGILALRLATLSQEVACKGTHGIYTIDEQNRLTWNLKQLKDRMDVAASHYSSGLCKKIEYLIFDRTFYAFGDLPTFLTSKIDVGYSQGKNSRVRQSGEKAKSQSRSKSPHAYSSHKKLGEKLALSKMSSPSQPQQSRVSAACEAHHNPKSSVYRLRVESLQNSRQKQNNQGSNSLNRLSPSPFDPTSPSRTATEPSPSKHRADRYAALRSELERELSDKMEELEATAQTMGSQDGSQYIGTVSTGGQRSGWGICYYTEGDVYAGQWKNNGIEGVGTYLFQNCDVYKGEVLNGLKHGRGKYQYFNGNYYDGQWKHDRKNGYGLYYNQEKQEHYEGNWLNGIKEGEGRYSWKNGDQYEGQFSNNLKSGAGVATKSDGSTVKGQWYGQALKGVACIKYRSGGTSTGNVSTKTVNQSQVLMLQGKCSHVFADGTSFSGEYQDNIRNGHLSKVQFPNGDIYCGAMGTNKFEGEGTYYYKQANFTYKGGWRNGLQHGLGCLVFHGTNQRDTVIQCIWNEGRPAFKGRILYGNGDLYEGEIGRLGRNGQGVYCRANGEKIEGVFKNGVLVSEKQ